MLLMVAYDSAETLNNIIFSKFVAILFTIRIYSKSVNCFQNQCCYISNSVYCNHEKQMPKAKEDLNKVLNMAC